VQTRDVVFVEVVVTQPLVDVSVPKLRDGFSGVLCSSGQTREDARGNPRVHVSL